METRQQLTAVIIGAIAAYIETEPQISSVTREAKPQPEANPQQRDPAEIAGKNKTGRID